MQNPMRLIQAGPGAGKTRRLVGMIKDLIDSGVSPFNILPMTFSREGAMVITDKMDGEVVGKTNHGFCLSVVKLACKMRGETAPHIAGDEEVKKIMKRAIQETDVSSIVEFGDVMKDYNSICESGKSLDSIMPESRVVITRYRQIMASEGLLDFPGILERANKELDDPDICSFYDGLHIFLDEGQDISPTGELPVIQKLFPKAEGATMYASPSQEIYSFRGSNFKTVRDMLPSNLIEEFMLENHRSTPEIIQASSVLAGDDAKGMIPVNPSGSKVKWADAINNDMEYDFIAHQINEWRSNFKLPWEQIAILVRLHDQTGPIERTLRARGIPISIVGTKSSIFERPEAQGLLGYVRLALNIMDDSVLETIIDFPPVGIGTRRRHAIRTAETLTWNDLSLALYNRDDHPDYVYDRIQGIVWLREELKRIMRSTYYPTTVDKLQAIIKCSGINDYLLAEGDRTGTRALDNLLDEAKNLRSIGEFADYLKVEVERSRVPKGVQISTLHTSKGREWQAVLMPGMQQGILPFEKGDPQEEKNLAFVGMTRAKEHLVLTSSRESKMSPFLEGTSQERIIWPR